METSQNPESRHFTIASRFEKQLKRAAQELSKQHQVWRVSAEPEWDPLISERVLVKPQVSFSS